VLAVVLVLAIPDISPFKPAGQDCCGRIGLFSRKPSESKDEHDHEDEDDSKFRDSALMMANTSYAFVAAASSSLSSLIAIRNLSYQGRSPLPF